MGRTNIDLDDDLVAEVMRRYHVKTKKEAVDLALRRLVGEPLTREFLLSLEGIGWEGDLDQMRRSDVVELSAVVVTKALRRYQRQLLAERDAEVYRETGGYPDLAGLAHLTPLSPD